MLYYFIEYGWKIKANYNSKVALNAMLLFLFFFFFNEIFPVVPENYFGLIRSQHI